MLHDAFDGRGSAIAYGSQGARRHRTVAQMADDAEAILEIRVADDNSALFLHYDHRELETAPRSATSSRTAC